VGYSKVPGSSNILPELVKTFINNMNFTMKLKELMVSTWDDIGKHQRSGFKFPYLRRTA